MHALLDLVQFTMLVPDYNRRWDSDLVRDELITLRLQCAQDTASATAGFPGEPNPDRYPFRNKWVNEKRKRLSPEAPERDPRPQAQPEELKDPTPVDDDNASPSIHSLEQEKEEDIERQEDIRQSVLGLGSRFHGSNTLFPLDNASSIGRQSDSALSLRTDRGLETQPHNEDVLIREHLQPPISRGSIRSTGSGSGLESQQQVISHNEKTTVTNLNVTTANYEETDGGSKIRGLHELRKKIKQWWKVKRRTIYPGS
jgi:hypothetical protein